ncbi:MAG: hypothetical protein EPO26_06835 [Chloroflexota bacterium]|nr:MAG: hypothetical protein EPO26_06835 [Chloroflexota bacterium]
MANVTISLPDDIVREARHLAVDRGESLSKFVSRLVEEQVGRVHERSAARERQRRMMAEGFHSNDALEDFAEPSDARDRARERLRQMMAPGLELGMPDKVTWTRDELYER